VEAGGPTLQPDDPSRAALNPANEPGRMSLITRMGADLLAANLPALLRACDVKAATWCGAAIQCTATR